jgi:hypothetical protein
LMLSLFGLVVTAALATYNERNDQLYDTLVGRAASIERELGLPDGAFANRPRAWFAPLRCWPVNHRWAVALIYGASTTLWLYSAAAAGLQLRTGDNKSVAHETLLTAAAAAILATAVAGFLIYWLREARRSALCASAATAVDRFMSHSEDLGELTQNNAFLEDCQRLGGINKDKVEKRILAYTATDRAERYLPDSSADEVERAAGFIALLTDLPPQWISDCYTGRRAS